MKPRVIPSARLIAGVCLALATMIPAWCAAQQARADRSETAAKQAAPISIFLTVNDRERKVLIGGRTRETISITAGTGENRVTRSLKISVVQEARFDLDVNFAKLSSADRGKRWGAAVKLLWPQIAPTLPYLDLPENNSVELAQMMGTYMYRAAERHTRHADSDAERETARAMYTRAYQVFLRVGKAEWHSFGKVARIKRLLCLLRLDKPKTARVNFDAIEEPYPGDAAYGIYYLVKAELALHKQQYRDAMQAAVLSLAFENKDIDTFPDALLISAQCYEELQQWHRARDVYYEVAKVFPGTDWATIARKRLAFIVKENLTTGEESHPIEEVFFAWSEDMNKRVDELLASSDHPEDDDVPEEESDPDTDRDLDRDVDLDSP